ncbi:conserved hypothetical protein [Anaeromyxobacter dehalogenans 2CP-1]|uniref:YetF C-terminal domain-containing protein n=1 Tax=Anaeromyxobacter dehalogenans (strain ATCC BAA-258 / DSM 21875 / 2CP-1) TaxID=455488 RepID=B8JHK4_ANAD2|nr:YetF domain-containing protein [Anaeromyxobacter dehalogenans]ACL66716.1 conserved hypothetical protein [Anaeromyxobacter dehalogenans 2CP-1]
MDSALWRPELPPWEVVFRAAFVYLFVQVLFRVVGRKEFARWGVSDIVLLFLVTTAVRKTLVADDASLTTAVVALTTLVALDWLFSLVTSRSRRAADLLEGRIRQLVRDGVLQRDVMRATRVSEDELLAHVRRLGKGSLADVKDAYLERSGSITVVLRA